MDNKEIKKVNLEKVTVVMLDGTSQKFEFAKQFAQGIFSNTTDIAEHAFAVDLYKNPEIEVTEENKTIINKYLDSLQYKAFIKIEINKLLNN